MNIDKICIVLMVSVAFIGIMGANLGNNTVYGAEKEITPTHVSVYMTNIYATIHVYIKNNNDHVQYFKISQTYTDHLVNPLSWRVISYNPTPLHMIDSVNPSGDLGWKVQPGQTKEVKFTLLAINSSGAPLKVYITDQKSVANTYWPLIPDPGLYSSWFQPNEIEILNTNLDLRYWKGCFSFDLKNSETHSVAGIIRAPIVPTDSKLVSSTPHATFGDTDMVMGTKDASWDVTLGPKGTDQGSKHYEYQYVWPSSSASSSTGKYSNSIPTANAASTTSPVSTKQTGVPYLPFVVGGILAAGGLAYARFRN